MNFFFSPLIRRLDVPSGCEIQEMLADIDQASTEVSGMTVNWKDLLIASLKTAREFEADQRYRYFQLKIYRYVIQMSSVCVYVCVCSSLSSWAKRTAGEVGSGEAVRGVPEGVKEQLEQLKVRF